MRSAEVQMGAYYDYDRQCWVKNGRVKKCGHREVMKGCYACAHAGELVTAATCTKSTKPCSCADCTLKPEDLPQTKRGRRR